MSIVESFHLRMGNFSGSRRKRCMKELQPVVRVLAELAAGTEEEFLELGGKLQGFYRRADEIAKMSSSIAGKMSGTEVLGATDRLQALCGRVRMLDGESREGAANLRLLLEKLDRTRNPLSGFERVVRNLNILCNFIKIENARFGACDTGFNTVAEDVRKLAASVESKSSQLLAKAEALIFLTRATLEEIAGFETRQRGQAGFILENTVQGLTALGEKNRVSAASLGNVAAMWQEMSAGIGKAVTSMQFHDITRQRLEHVRDALGDTAGNLARRDHNSEDLRLAAATCELQSAQLRHASDELVAAVEQMRTNIGNIAGGAEAISRETQKIAEIDGKTGRSFLGKMETELSILTGAVSEYAAIHRSSWSALSRVTDTVGDMSIFVEEIDRIGVEMNMIALNACIHAAHIGEEGMALGVLATSIQQLSDETSKRIGTVEETLKSIITAAAELSAGAARETGRKTEEAGAMASDLRTLGEPFCELDRDIISLVNRIERAGRALSEDIETAINGITAHTRIAAEIGAVRRTLDAVASGLRSLISVGHPLDRGEKLLGSLAVRYTMQKERDVHRAAAASGFAVPVLAIAGGDRGNAGAAGAGIETGNRLGDNVELF